MPCKHFKDHFCHLSRNRDSTMTSTAVARCLSICLSHLVLCRNG